MTTPNNPENPYNANNPFSSDSTGKLPSYGEATSKENEEYAHDANNYGVDNTAHDHASHDAYGTNATAAGAGYPAYAGADSQPAKKNAVAIWAMVIGIIALLSLLLIVPPLLLGPIGIIVSIIALVVGRNRPQELRRTWMSIVGLITSILALAGTIVIMALGVKLLGDTGAAKCLELQDPAQQQACMEETLGTASQQ
ncbi:hypothetical membrane protein [Corynebacterium striatum]|uniref:DUF4190 domain-containing protein n=1 Tax=Corynebacterium striatum TaxID=43770 RepID=A0AAQ1TVW9_CORST|nr:stage III sporulation AC/AD family protein [Corynebacterium striatum]EEI78547.1 hypothetical protein HMPREF0308_1176 [Corynebacterium striatum ATCC 6940]QQE53707.1 hypothetical protein I6I11_03645 [Corynebacterium striatum]STD62309.1 hypothetical membrane protein [Corynebacterium striatum]GEA43565.1 hypothetical protein Cst04h_17350 [Corynebacterium striatum]GEA44463.1 hypothetical protein Cst04h_26330 [Corynebacterium striatum]